MPGRFDYLAIMDDLLLQSSKYGHLEYSEDHMKELLKNDLKLLPRKCQFFRNKLQYMDNTIFIKPLKTKLTGIQKLKQIKQKL